MVERLWCALTQDLATTFEVANHLFFLGVNTEYGDFLVKALINNSSNLSKLCVPVLYVLECLELDKRTLLKAAHFYHLADVVVRNAYIMFFQFFPNLWDG